MGQFFTLIILIPIIGICLAYLIYDLPKRKDKQAIAKYEFHESIALGATEEPHAIRDLNKDERGYLTDRHRILYWIITHPIFWIGFYILVFLVFYNLDSKHQSGGSIEQLTVFWGIFSLIFTIIAFIGSQQIENNYYKDSRVAVWQVQGMIMDTAITKDKFGHPIQAHFTVRKKRFSVLNMDISTSTQIASFHSKERTISSHRNLYKIVSGFTPHTEVIVEYSPFTKHVWDVKLAKQ